MNYMLRQFGAFPVIEQDVFVADKTDIGEKLFLLSLEMRQEAYLPQPGQFVMLRATQGLDPLLGRPFAICGFEGDRLDILVATVGRGTRLLRDLRPGTRLSMRGPLGNPFPDRLEGKIYCLAGSVGIAPFLLSHPSNARVEIHLGVPGEEWAPLADWAKGKTDRLTVYSEDGKFGIQGNPLLCLEGVDRRTDVVWACGPNGMLKAMSRECGRLGIETYVSLETRMACGVGGCHGCTVRTVGGLKKNCTDGPVFRAEEVLWDETR